MRNKMTPAEVHDFFERLPMFGIKMGLDNTRNLLRLAGNPEKDLRFIHIAGTNGKGSTGAMLECALRRSGLNTGFYTSPHLTDIRERFRVNGRAVPMELFCNCVEELLNAASYGTDHCENFTYFEFLTVLAAMIFSRAGVDAVIWETGMGGRLDATNTVTPQAVVITNIALDHQAYLGNTVEEIAAEKAGIIKDGAPLFCGVMSDAARNVLLERARNTGSPVTGPAPEITGKVRYVFSGNRLCQQFQFNGRQVTLALPGAMQRRNFRLVSQVLAHFAPRWGFDFDRALDALEFVRWPGRCQWLNERLIIDGGHTPDGLTALQEALKEVLPGEKFTVVFAAFKDKEVRESLSLLAPLASEFIFVPIRETGRPCWSAEEFAGMLKELAIDIPCRGMDNGSTAVSTVICNSRQKVLVAGSLFLAGEVLDTFSAPRDILDLV